MSLLLSDNPLCDLSRYQLYSMVNALRREQFIESIDETIDENLIKKEIDSLIVTKSCSVSLKTFKNEKNFSQLNDLKSIDCQTCIELRDDWTQTDDNSKHIIELNNEVIEDIDCNKSYLTTNISEVFNANCDTITDNRDRLLNDDIVVVDENCIDISGDNKNQLQCDQQVVGQPSNGYTLTTNGSINSTNNDCDSNDDIFDEYIDECCDDSDEDNYKKNNKKNKKKKLNTDNNNNLNKNVDQVNSTVDTNNTSDNSSGDQQQLICLWKDCCKVFTTFDKYSDHIRRHGSEHSLTVRPFRCQLGDCCSSFKVRCDLTRHIMKCHLDTYRCDYKGCSYKTGHKKLFISHQSSHSTVKSVKCDYNGCNAMFKSETNRKQHQLSIHPDMWPDVPWRKCPYAGCAYKTKYSDNMYNHKKRHTRPHKCDECGKGFNDNNVLQAHRRTHNSALKFGCDWPGCERLFARKQVLARHLNSHTGQKIYRCDWPDCDKQYVVEGSLALHKMRTHKGWSEYRCHWPACDYQTTNTIRFTYHMQKHDGSVPVYECQSIDCNYKTKMKDAFDIHMKTKHN
ncbi:zinc finger protein 626-like [Oppia nitens]|uniref:zinc finger protein 626-like n=1 Tax=Oppia nitens TaxID=1686743 RepID=UPI0023DA437C|nr:zinc finger protein 626-like [Oppia nitens]